MRDCLILVTLLSLAGCASIGPAKETPPANQANPMPAPAEPKTLLHVP
jgi:predicted small lipoprotein YifL